MVATSFRVNLPSGWQGLCLRNEHLEVTLVPERGGQIQQITARRQEAREVDLLWQAPWPHRPPPVAPLPPGADSQAVWMDNYTGGWQVLFPNAGGACTVNGAPHTFHGEASVVPWQCEVVERAPGVPEVRLVVRLARTPFRLERRVWLEADRPVLRIQERVINEGAQAQPFVWGHHPAFGAPFLQAGCRLDVPARTFLAGDSQVSQSAWVAPGVRSQWPHVARIERAGGGTVDLSVVPGPETHTDTFGFLLDLEEGWYALSNDALGTGFGLVWPLDVFPCVWLWQELGGTQGYPWWGNTYVMGVEPHSSSTADGLATAIERGTAHTLAPGEQLEAELTAVLFEPRGRVSRVSRTGEVTFG